MSDWDEVKIGSKARGGAVAKETVVRGKGALNAAQRSGLIVGQEKKFAVGNAAKGNTEGQRQKKLDDNPDIIKPKTVGKEVGQMIMNTRQNMEPKLDRAGLAKKAMITPSELALWENGTATPDQKKFGQLERALNICLQGTNFGQPKFGKKK